MRHRVYGKHLGRNTNQRNALFKGLVRSLILHESITTTETKAKAIKGLVDRVISKGKEDSTQARRFIQSVITDTEVAGKLVKEIVPRYTNRASGFTGIVRLGRRLGDGAEMVKVSLLDGEAAKSSKGAKEEKEKKEEKKLKETEKEVKKTVKDKETVKKTAKPKEAVKKIKKEKK